MSNPLVKARVSMVTAVSARKGRRQAGVGMFAGRSTTEENAGAFTTGGTSSGTSPAAAVVRLKKGTRDAAQMSPSPTVRNAIQPAVE